MVEEKLIWFAIQRFLGKYLAQKEYTHAMYSSTYPLNPSNSCTSVTQNRQPNGDAFVFRIHETVFNLISCENFNKFRLLPKKRRFWFILTWYFWQIVQFCVMTLWVRWLHVHNTIAFHLRKERKNGFYVARKSELCWLSTLR